MAIMDFLRDKYRKTVEPIIQRNINNARAVGNFANQQIRPRAQQYYPQVALGAGRTLSSAANLAAKVNIPAQLANRYLPKQFSPIANTRLAQQKMTNIAEKYKPTTKIGKVGRFAGENLPYFLLPTTRGITATEIASPAKRMIANTALRSGEGALIGAAQGFAEDKTRQDILRNAKSGAITAGVLNTVMSPLATAKGVRELASNARKLTQENRIDNAIYEMSKSRYEPTISKILDRFIPFQEMRGRVYQNKVKQIAETDSPEEIARIVNPILRPTANVNHYQDPRFKGGFAKLPIKETPEKANQTLKTVKGIKPLISPKNAAEGVVASVTPAGKGIKQPLTETQTELATSKQYLDNLINQEAKARREFEEAAGVGIMKKETGIGEGGGLNYSRYTEHSSEYRDYFKKTGHKPGLDWWKQQVTKELESGKGELVGEYNAVKNYVSQLEKQVTKEGGRIPIQNLSEKAQQIKVKVFPKKIEAKQLGRELIIPIKRPQEFIPPKDIGVGTKIKRAFTSGDVELSRQGKSGQELVDKIKFQRTNAERLRGSYQVKLQEALQGLNKSERNIVGQVLDGKMQTGTQVGNPRIIQAIQKTRAILDDIGIKAQEIGLKIKTPSGEVPFKMRENYFPRVYDFTDLQKASQRQKAMQHLVDSGQAQNIAEADKMLETFIKDNTIRRAGNLEHARVIDLPGYELDPLKAVNKYIDSASRRLTEANTFGATDEVAKRLIDRVRQEGGDYKYAQEVFDLMTGQKKYQNLAVDLATKFNYITKLDLGFITNATQPINTAVKTGIINTLDGIMKAYLTPYKAGKFARQVGAVTDEIVKGRAEGLTMGRLMEGVLAPFSYIERKNRVISAVAGKNFAEQLANKLIESPESKYAIRQLKSIGIDPEKIIAQGKITPDDILGGAKAVSDKTQFKVDAIDIPPGWKTNIGRLLTQFKSFSFQQTKFIRDEVIKEAIAGNFAPLVKLIALAVPASFVAQSVRNKLTGRDPRAEEKSLDVRKLDNYLKAFGTVPTDLVIQGKFLADTYRNEYATPLKKIGRTLSTFGGPTVGEAFNITNALEQAGTIKKQNQLYNQEKDPYLDIKRTVSGYLPFMGEVIKNKVFAYPATYAKGAENAGKTITQQIKDLKKGKKVEDTPIAQMADGRFRYRIGTESKYADTRQEAQLAIDKDIFDKSGKKSELKNGIYYYRNKNGKPDSMPESEYIYKLRNQKIKKAKDAKDYNTWVKLANEKLADIEKQWQDADPLTKSELENDYLDLLRKMKKYQSYGGRFTKGKKRGGSKRAKKPKIISLSLRKSTYGMRPTLRKFTAPKISLKTISGGNYGTNTVRPRAIR